MTIARITDYLDPSHSLYEPTIKFLEILKINNTFQYHLALLENTKLSLNFYAKHETKNVAEATQIASYFDATSTVMMADGIRFMIPPKKEVASKFPIARAFCREIRNQDLELVHALRARIILNIIFGSNAWSSKQLAEISRQLDLVVTSVDARQTIITTLSRSIKRDSDSILNELKNAITQNPKLASKHKPLANALELIFTLKITPPSVQVKHKTPTPPLPTRRPKISIRIETRVDDIDEPRPRNTASINIEMPLPTKTNFDPEPKLIISPNAPSRTDEDKDTFDDAEVTKHTTQTTARWYSNLVNRTPVSSTRLSHITKKHFMSRWLVLGSGHEQEQQLAIVIGLFYATGENIESILRWKIGDNGMLNSQLKYVKTWLSPPDIFTPEISDQNLYENKINTLELPFNTSLTDLLSRHLSGHPSATLGEQIDQDETDCTNRIKLTLEGWRANGRYPLKLPKVRAALSTELWVLFRHHPTVYILAGSDAHKPHVINYYQTTKRNVLQNRWREVQNALFQQ